MLGVVKMFRSTKRYGFISADDGSGDYFVHIDEIQTSKTLAQGDKVQFEPGKQEKGLIAKKVRLLKED